MAKEKYIALLRGINVGRNATVPMPELAKLCAKLGWQNVRTYLRTGNVIFEAGEQAEQCAKVLEDSVLKKFSFTVPAIVRSHARFSSYLAHNPLPAEAHKDPSRLLLYFSKNPPVPTAVDGLLSKASAGETAVQHDDVIWVYYPKGISGSRITPAVIDRSIGSPATGRNWNTLTKIQAMCSE